jgi:phenylacetic acid degradation operon negative regulatory protein
MQQSRNTPAGTDGTGLLARPLTARSVIASLLLGMHPPRMPARRLVQWCELFGIRPGAARVALSRMTERGELHAFNATYELAGGIRSRQASQDWSLRPEVTVWDGTWSLALVTGGSVGDDRGTRGGNGGATGTARSAEERAALRTALRRCRFAEVREGCWTRPGNLPRASAPDDAWAVADAQCRWWHGAPDDGASALVEQLFAVGAWAARARELLARNDRVVGALERLDHAALHDGFVLGAATLQHIRNDPLLPGALLPARWPGDELRDAYRAYERAFSSAVSDWFRTTDAGAPRRRGSNV